MLDNNGLTKPVAGREFNIKAPFTADEIALIYKKQLYGSVLRVMTFIALMCFIVTYMVSSLFDMGFVEILRFIGPHSGGLQIVTFLILSWVGGLIHREWWIGLATDDRSLQKTSRLLDESHQFRGYFSNVLTQKVPRDLFRFELWLASEAVAPSIKRNASRQAYRAVYGRSPL